MKSKQPQSTQQSKQSITTVRKKQRKQKHIKNTNACHILNDELVHQYLIENPDFFIRNAQQIADLVIPHPVRGAISLPEWQLARQRIRIQELETEITLLMEQASFNQKLFESLIELLMVLLQADSFSEFIKRLDGWAKSMGLIGAYLYLFDNKWQVSPPSNYYSYALSPDKFDFIRVRHLQYHFQYLGQLNTTELELLITDTQFVGSVAMTLLGEYGDLGVLVFASRHKDHYQAGQGTFLLEKLSKVLPLFIEKWVHRK